jgi:hypothetical protein
MSLKLNTASGGSISLQEADTASNLTATLPAATGTVMVSGNMPAFSATMSANQTGITSLTQTKVVFNTEEFDTGSCFDTATYRFTPNVAGYYQINGSLYVISSLTGTYMGCSIFKNGSNYASGTFLSSAQGEVSSVSSHLIYLNGTTDYVELYGFSLFGAGSTTFIAGGGSRFSGCLVRAA